MAQRTASRAPSVHTQDRDAHDARRFTLRSGVLQVAWLVSEANAYTALTFSWFASCVSHVDNGFSVYILRLTCIVGLWLRGGIFFVSFSVLVKVLEVAETVEVLNTILRYSYIDVMLTCFPQALTLGNRP